MTESALSIQSVSVNPLCIVIGTLYAWTVPKLWNETIEEHRRAVRDAVLEATVALVAEQGLRGVTMSRIAEETGIGRATLYKYFPDVESILLAWHERQITGHLHQLAELRDGPGGAGERLAAVLDTYAFIQHRRHGHGAELSALLHRGEHVLHAERHLHGFVRDLLAEAAAAGRSGTTSRRTNWPPTACTPSRRRAVCPPRPRSGGSSRSPWPGCAARADLSRDGVPILMHRQNLGANRPSVQRKPCRAPFGVAGQGCPRRA